MKPITVLMPLSIFAAVMGCDTKDWESIGFQDGFAATVNTVCGFRATLVHGKYDNSKYAKGYALGSNAATLDVQRRGCDALR
jgi:hypothetical protein